jgi:hypothetical protein
MLTPDEEAVVREIEQGDASFIGVLVNKLRGNQGEAMWTLTLAFLGGYASDLYDEFAEWSKMHVSQVVSVQILSQGDGPGQYTRLVVWHWRHVPDTGPNRAEAALMAPDPDLEPDLASVPGSRWSGPFNTLLG